MGKDVFCSQKIGRLAFTCQPPRRLRAKKCNLRWNAFRARDFGDIRRR